MAEIDDMIYAKKVLQHWYNLEKKFIPPQAWESDLLTLWRERIIFFLFFFAAVFAPIVLIPSLILSFNEGLWGVFILDSIAYIIVVVVLLSHKFSLRQKTWIIFLVFYFLGTGLLFVLGFYGGGYIWLFGATLIVGAMIGIREANIALFINFLSLVSIGIYIAVGSPEWASGIENAIQKWMVMTANFMLINILVTLLVVTMLESLKIALTREQKTAMELREKHEELTAILKASPDPILVYDNFNHVQYLNNAFTTALGWHLDDVKGKEIPFIPEGQQKVFCDLFVDDISEVEEATIRFETTRYTKNGLLLNISLSAAPIKGNMGDTIGIVVNMKDITELKKMELNLQQAQKMESIGTLAGGIAHDFNNILFPIIGHTEMLLSDVSNDSLFRSSLEKIYSAAGRAKELVKQILTFSRQESSELILMKMQPIVKEALKLIRSSIPTTIEIKQDIRKECGMIKADPTQIHQVVMNLTTNAYHAMDEIGGELKVNLKEVQLGESDIKISDMVPGAYACLIVADTGQGMDKDLIRKIFDPFFTTKKKGKGTGMGLSVVHGIVKSMEGAIHVNSEPGKGTEFLVYLPVAKSSSKEKNMRDKKPFQYGTERILLLDDEQPILTMEKEMLERLGYQVTSHSSSLEAMQVFRAAPNKFDMVITDMAMPKMPGDKLSVELIKIRQDIPILLCTGFSEAMSEEKAMSLGIKGFLLKPIALKDFSQKIREVLDGIKDTTQQ